MSEKDQPQPEEHLHEHPMDVDENIYQQVLAGRSTLEHIKDPEMRVKLERTQVAMEEVAIGIHDLHLLPQEAQVEALDAIVGQVFDQDETAQSNIERIKSAREQGNADEEKLLMAEQSQLFDNMRHELAFVLGVEIENIEAENDSYREVLMAKVADLSGVTDEQIMKKLGFLIEDEKTGELRFNFPRDIFPPHILEKWDRYEGLVREHVRASAKFDRGLEDTSSEIVQLDALRRYAHNHLANTVQEFLQLENWDLERCRKFITKMIEQRFPTVETKESQLTSDAILSHLRTIKALGDVVQHENEED